MKKTIWIFIASFLFFHTATAQNITDLEMQQLADNLAKAVESRMSGQNIAIADFVGMDDKPSDLGKFLAEEFSYALVNSATRFKVVDRTQLRRLMEEAGIGDKGMVDPGSVQKLGRLEGITAVVYGKLIPAASTIKVYVKVVILETQVNVIEVKGDLTRTPTIDEFLGIQEPATKPVPKVTETPRSAEPARSTPFSYENIYIQLAGCARNGEYTDCEVQITNRGTDDNFTLKTENTQLVDTGRTSYRATMISMNGKTSSYQGSAVIRQNATVSAIVRFAGIPASIRTFSALELHCVSLAAFSFTGRLNNISLNP